MSIDPTLFSAILAMDAYNRSYNAGISGLGGINSQIGLATIISESDVDPGTPGVNASFYALAYNVDGVSGFSAGEKSFLTGARTGLHCVSSPATSLT